MTTNRESYTSKGVNTISEGKIHRTRGGMYNQHIILSPKSTGTKCFDCNLNSMYNTLG